MHAEREMAFIHPNIISLGNHKQHDFVPLHVATKTMAFKTYKL